MVLDVPIFKHIRVSNSTSTAYMKVEFVNTLKFLSLFIAGGTDYVIATTKLINGNSLLDKLVSDITPAKLNPF